MHLRWIGAVVLMALATNCAYAAQAPVIVNANAQSLMSSSSTQSPASSASVQHKIHFGPSVPTNAPFDGKVLVTKVLALLQKHGGYIAPSDLEAAFGVKVRQTRALNGGYRVVLKGATDWYSNIDYTVLTKPDPKNMDWVKPGDAVTSLDILWAHPAGDPAYCVNPMEIKSRLESIGWVVRPKKPVFFADFYNPNFFDFYNPTYRSEVSVVYGDGKGTMTALDPAKTCLIDLTIYGIKP
jgi:hypothetical protein